MSKLAAAGLSSTVAVAAGRARRPRGRGLSAVVDRLLEEAARSVRARPGAAEQPLELGSALADQDGGGGALGDDGGEVAEVDALVAPAGDQDDRRVERAQRRDDRVGLRALRVVDEADAVDLGDALEAVLDALERAPPRAGSRPGRSRTGARRPPPRGRSRRCGRPATPSSATGMIRPPSNGGAATGPADRRAARSRPRRASRAPRRGRPAAARRGGTGRRAPRVASA